MEKVYLMITGNDLPSARAHAPTMSVARARVKRLSAVVAYTRAALETKEVVHGSLSVEHMNARDEFQRACVELRAARGAARALALRIFAASAAAFAQRHLARPLLFLALTSSARCL